MKKIQTDLRRLRRELRRSEEKRYRYKDLMECVNVSKDTAYRLWNSGRLAFPEMRMPKGATIRYSTEAQVREYERGQ